ncbi:MAG: hypothetical protein R3D99_07740 [Altererythrobacter sp.]
MAVRSFVLGLVAASLLVPVAVSAQDEGLIVVTGSRVDRDEYDRYYDDDQSAIGLTRKADFFVKPIYVSSDSRDAETRKEELLAMLRATIERAESDGLRLVAGNYKLTPVTLARVDELDITAGRRPDTSRVLVYVRIPVGSGPDSVKDADERIERFVKSIPVTGRSYIETGSTALAINNPQQYRGAVVKAIADESKRYAAMFGNDYGIEIRGLDSELYFKQASETEVFLYIQHSFVIKPK